MNSTTETANANFITDQGSIRLRFSRARRGPREAAELTDVRAARTASPTRAAPTAAAPTPGGSPPPLAGRPVPERAGGVRLRRRARWPSAACRSCHCRTSADSRWCPVEDWLGRVPIGWVVDGVSALALAGVAVGTPRRRRTRCRSAPRETASPSSSVGLLGRRRHARGPGEFRGRRVGGDRGPAHGRAAGRWRAALRGLLVDRVGRGPRVPRLRLCLRHSTSPVRQARRHCEQSPR